MAVTEECGERIGVTYWVCLMAEITASGTRSDYRLAVGVAGGGGGGGGGGAEGGEGIDNKMPRRINTLLILGADTAWLIFK